MGGIQAGRIRAPRHGEKELLRVAVDHFFQDDEKAIGAAEPERGASAITNIGRLGVRVGEGLFLGREKLRGR